MKGFRKLGEPLFSLGLTQRLAVGSRHVAGGVSDTTAPYPVITSSETSPTFAATIPLSIAWRNGVTGNPEAVTGFAVGDITVVGCTLGSLTTSDNITFSVTATPTANAITVDIAAGVCQDAAGNTNTAAVQFAITSLGFGLIPLLKPDTISGNDGDMVAAWADQTPNAKDFAQTDDVKKPLLKKAANGINNLAVVRFDGSNDLLTRAENFLSSSSGIIFAIVRMNTAFANLETVLSSSDEAVNNTYFNVRCYESATHPRMAVSQKNNDTTDQIKGSTVLLVDTAYLMAWMSSGTAYRLRLNGREETLTIVSGANTGDWLGDVANRDNFAIGALKINSELGILKGDLGDLLMYNYLPADAVISQIESQLATRWGITLLNPLAGGTATATNAAAALTTPTYDTSGQAVHPDIYDAGSGNTWNGKRFWMALTPYPAGNNDYENPSILVSDDGETWAVPDGLTNPVVAFPGGASFNADPDIILGQDNKLYLFYMTSDGSTYNKCMVKSSTDGVTWSAATELFSTAYKSFASPAVIWDGSQYVMFYTDVAAAPYKLYKRTCATPNGTWSAATQVSITPPWGYDVWHLDVVVDGSTYYAFMTLCTSGTEGSSAKLWMAKSTNAGATWLLYADAPTMTISAGWDNKSVYRTTGVRNGTGFDIWYSGSNTGDVWHIGKTTVTLA